MKYLLLFWLFVLAKGDKQDCDVVVIRDQNFEKQVLKNNVHNPYQLAIDYQTSTLFFSFSSEVDGKTLLKSGYLNLKTKEFGEIADINNGMANAVDSVHNIVYLGGKDGVYTYDYATKKAKNLGITDYSIWQMFYCPIHGLVITTYKPDEKSFIYIDGQFKPMVEFTETRTRLVAVGQHHDIYFSNSSALFLYNMHQKSFTNLGDYNVNGFARDPNGQLYFSTPNEIYFVNEHLKKMEKLLSVTDNSIYGVALDANSNIIYASEDSIVKLVPTTKKC